MPAELRSPDMFGHVQKTVEDFCLTADSIFGEFSNLGYINVININNNNNDNNKLHTRVKVRRLGLRLGFVSLMSCV